MISSSCARPLFAVGDRQEGAGSGDGLVAGTYLHGLFGDDAFRAVFLATFGVGGSGTRYELMIERVLDRLAEHLERHLPIERLLAIAGYTAKANPTARSRQANQAPA